MSTAATGIRLIFHRDTEKQLDVADSKVEHRVPLPRYRHAAPSAPWPWMDFNQDEADVRPLTPSTDIEPWSKYPQSHFRNWTPNQVRRCRMWTICQDNVKCQIHKVNVLKDGRFQKGEDLIPMDLASENELWDDLEKPFDPNVRVRALFVENITMSVLKILGASYNIEPSFFASSANWIPARYQEDPQRGIGDHITIVLPFIRTVGNQQEQTTLSIELYSPDNEGPAPPITDEKQTIDTQAPLILSDKMILLQDLLAIHMVRNVKQNIIISYHHHSKLQKPTARLLQSLVQRIGDSVYWSKIYDRSKDPTFLLLAIFWYALYAWDETLEAIYAHLSERLEATDSTTHLAHTRELHKLKAHLLFYQQLLQDFRKSVEFIRDTPNPAMEQELIPEDERENSKKLLYQESGNLLSEIERLETQRKIQSERLENVMTLYLTMATLRDSAIMKQISYLTILFLPATYLSGVFGMNVTEINPGTLETLPKYVESTIILTAITAWIMIALQDHSPFHPGGRDYMHRMLWPLFCVYGSMLKLVEMIIGAKRKATI